jgi:hypothetical protein
MSALLMPSFKKILYQVVEATLAMSHNIFLHQLLQLSIFRSNSTHIVYAYKMVLGWG